MTFFSFLNRKKTPHKSSFSKRSKSHKRSKKTPKKRSLRKLSGGSWSCPTFIEKCRLAEGKSWDETQVQFHQALREIKEQKLKEYFESHEGQLGGQIIDGIDQPLKEAAIKACNKLNPTQFEHGKCIKKINRLKEKIDFYINDRLPSKPIFKTSEDEEAYKRQLEENEAEREERERQNLKAKVEREKNQAAIMREYEKSSGLVQPYIDALRLLGKPSQTTKTYGIFNELTYIKRITDSLVVKFNVDNRSISIFAQINKEGLHISNFLLIKDERF